MALGCEGIVSKRLGSPYRSGRSEAEEDWGQQPTAKITRRSISEAYPMTNPLQQAINCDDADRAARMLQDALGIESDDVVNYCFPKTWPTDRELRARIIGDWLKTEACYLA